MQKRRSKGTWAAWRYCAKNYLQVHLLPQCPLLFCGRSFHPQHGQHRFEVCSADPLTITDAVEYLPRILCRGVLLQHVLLELLLQGWRSSSGGMAICGMSYSCDSCSGMALLHSAIDGLNKLSVCCFSISGCILGQTA